MPAYGITNSAGRLGGGFNWGNLASIGGALGGPWGMGLGALAGGLAAFNNAPSERDIAQQKMNFSMDWMNQIPGLAAKFRSLMIGGSGGQQMGIIGGANAFRNNLQRNIVNQGWQNTGLASLVNSMAASKLGEGMSNMYGGYNMAGFNMANQNLMQALQQSLAGWQQQGTQSQVAGAMLGAGGRLADRVLYPRQTTNG